MRGQLPIDAQAWLTDPSVSTLSAQEQGGLVNLLCHAWVSTDLTVPADLASLAAMTRLGDAFSDSRLHASLLLWFRPIVPVPAGGPRLSCTLLEPYAKKREALSAVRRKVATEGRALTKSRAIAGGLLSNCSANGEQKLVAMAAVGEGEGANPLPGMQSGNGVHANPGPPARATPAADETAEVAGHPRPCASIGATPHSIGASAPAVETPPTEGGGTPSVRAPVLPPDPIKRDPNSNEKSLSQMGGGGRAELPADVEAALRALVPDPAGGTVVENQVKAVLVGLGFKVEGQYGVGPTGYGADGYIDLYATRGGFTLAVEVDRATPKGGSIRKLAQAQATFKLILLRTASGDRPPAPGVDRVMGMGRLQKDLFGNPVPFVPKRQRGGKKADAVVLAVAVAVVDLYEQLLGTAHRRSVASDRNCAHWLANGYTREQLETSVRHYAEFCAGTGRLPEFRKSSANFFGVRDPEFKSYLLKGTAKCTPTTQPTPAKETLRERLERLSKDVPRRPQPRGSRNGPNATSPSSASPATPT